MKKARGVYVFGVLNIVAGCIFLTLEFMPFLFIGIGGWVADRGPLDFWDWLTLFVIFRISYIALFLGVLAFLVSGILLLISQRSIAIRFSIISSFTVVLSVMFNLGSWNMNYLFNPAQGDLNRALEFVFDELLSWRSIGYYILGIYAIALIVFLNRVEVKKQFK